MPSSGRQVSWAPVSVTPAGGSLATILTVKDVQIDPRAEVIRSSGDADFFYPAKKIVREDPMMTIQLEDGRIFNTYPPGTKVTVAATHQDEYNGVGSGAITYTIVGFISGAARGGPHADFGRGTLVIESQAVDGQTTPLSISVAA